MRFAFFLLPLFLCQILQAPLFSQFSTIIYDGVTGVEHCHMESDTVLIMHVVKKSPAWEADLKRYDRILSIDAVPVSGQGYSLREVFDLLLDTYGTSVELEILREGEDSVRSYTLERVQNDSPSIWFDYSYVVDSLRSYTIEEIWNDSTGPEFTHILESKLHITGVAGDSPAEEMGIRKGDNLIGLANPMDNHDYLFLDWIDLSRSYFDTVFSVLRGADTLYIPFDTKENPEIGGISSQFWNDFQQESVWLKFQFISRISTDINYLLTIDCDADTILIYQKSDHGELMIRKTGNAVHPGEKDFIHRGNYTVRIPIRKDQNQTVFVQIHSQASIYPPYLGMVPVETILRFDRLERFIIGAFSGIMILICFYYLVLFYSTRRKQFLYYSLFVISFLLLLLYEWDFHLEYIGGKVLLVINDLSDLIYALPVFFFLLFGIHYLDLRENLRTWYRIAVINLIVLVLINLIINGYHLAVPFRSNNWILQGLYVIYLISSFVIPLALLPITSIIRIVRGFKPAWYFLLAFVFMMVLGIIQSTSWQQISAESAYISDIWEILGGYVIIFGVTLQFLVFSLGLARKIKLDEKEKELAQLKVIEQLKENEQLKDKVNRELEQKVMERTEEIRTQKEEIEAQRDEIEAQRDQLQEQRDVLVKQKDRLTDSITYAQRIQTAVLPPQSYLDQVMPEYFVLFKPRDIVSGDFYWVKEFNNKLVPVAADCTGHGVPGAFMSMLGITLLNEQTGKSRLDTPGEILNWLRKKVKETLAQESKESEQKDGMDLALAIVDKDRLRLQYAGAYNPLYLVRHGEPANPEAFPGGLLTLGKDYHLMEYKADRQPVSIHFEESDFTTKSIQLQKGDTLYLFTDGYVDQVGGPGRKKYLSKRFKDLLLQYQSKSLKDQKLMLEQTLEEWSRGYEQIDDILLMGVRV